MAVIESKGDGYALFNGVKLPSLPDYDKTAYPYAFIGRRLSASSATMFFVVSTSPFNINADGNSVASANCYSLVSNGGKEGSVAWKDFGDPIEVTEGSERKFGTPIWSNYDILNTTDNSVFLAKSDPIPLDGMNVIEWDGDTTGLESLSSQCYFVSYNTDLDTTRNVVCTRSDDVTSFELMSEDDGYWALGRYVYYSATSTDDYYLSGIEFRKNSNYHVNLFAYHPIEEPTTPIGFIEYLVNPKYHMGKPFRGFIGWKMAQKGDN